MIAGLPCIRSSGINAISRTFVLAILAVGLTACGGNGGSPSREQQQADTTPPVINLTGDNPQVVSFNEVYTELGATASDNHDGDLTASIVIDASAVDTATPGDYVVTYDVTDAAGNAAETTTRTVTVLPPVPEPAEVSIEGDIKQLVFSWDEVQYADYYRLLENPDGHSGFTQVGEDIAADTLTATQDIAVHLFDWVNALYIVQACNGVGCTGSNEISAVEHRSSTIGFLEDLDPAHSFYRSIAMSADGTKIAVGVLSGAYLFTSNGSNWSSELIIVWAHEPARPGGVALSADGNTLAISDTWDSSGATDINGNPNDISAERSGAVHLFRFDGISWDKEAYIKASNTGSYDLFGSSLALSADGNTLLVGAPGEDSSALGINGDQDDDSEGSSGAAYLFRFDGAAWSQQAYIKPSNTPMSGEFGYSVALSANGETLAVGAPHEDSCTNQVNGDQFATCPGARPGDAFGAVYVFRFEAQGWWQQAYLKGRAYGRDYFGSSLAMSADGNTLAVGEPSGLALDTSGAFVFRFDGMDWFKEDFFDYDLFDPEGRCSKIGTSIAINDDASLIALDGRYLLQFDGFTWGFSNNGTIYPPWDDDPCGLGDWVALSGGGATLVVLKQNDGVYLY